MRTTATNKCRTCGLLLALMLVTSQPATAQEPPASESLPPPRQVPPDGIVLEEPAPNPAYFRTSRYDIWQFYAVDPTGHFRPRVVLAPYGAYYLINGQPFPWVSTHMTDVTPIIANEAVMMPYAED